MPKNFKSKPKAKTKRVYKKHYHKKGVSKIKTLTLRCPFRKGLQMFPDRYLVKGHTNYSSPITIPGASGTVQKYVTLHIANQVTNGNGPATSLNNASYSAFATNVPAGLFYLLGDPNKSSVGTGGNAPFLEYRVHSSMIKVTWIADATTTAAPVQLTIVPVNEEGANGSQAMPITQIAEQPYAKTKYYTPTMFSLEDPLTNKMSTLHMVGDEYKSSLEDGLFDGAYNTAPTTLVYWVVALGTISPSTIGFSINGTLTLDIWQDIEFFHRNTFITTIPT